MNSGGSAGSRTPYHLIKSPLPSSNISKLAQKTMQTKHLNADKMQTNLIVTIRYPVMVSIAQKRENGGFSWRVFDCKELVG